MGNLSNAARALKTSKSAAGKAAAARELGKVGGKSKSPAKLAASRRNEWQFLGSS